MGESNTPLVDGLFPICTKDVFDAYHDPSVHIFLSIVFGIFGLVFLYYAIARRPRFEYFLLFAVCALQVGAFILRIYSDITDAFIALMVYSAAIAVAVGVMYSMLVRWTWIADRYYGKRVFDRGYGNNVVIGVVSVVLAGLLVAGIWVASTIWVVYLALILVMWLTSNVYLGIHRRMKPSMEERTIVMSTMESGLGYAPLVTSHKQLDNMLVFMIVLLTVELVKTIFLPFVLYSFLCSSSRRCTTFFRSFQTWLMSSCWPIVRRCRYLSTVGTFQKFGRRSSVKRNIPNPWIRPWCSQTQRDPYPNHILEHQNPCR